ncbi:MAG: biopolymer transporter ExbD [Cellvibrionaceae bacterium]
MNNQQTQEEDLEVNMTPMLDIVFIMLIFFIVTAVFVKEPGVDVTRPDASTSKNVKRISTIIGITENNEIWINKKEMTLSDIRPVVSKLKQENPKGNVVIQADKNSDASIVVQVVEQLNLIGVSGISIATREGGAS